MMRGALYCQLLQLITHLIRGGQEDSNGQQVAHHVPLPHQYSSRRFLRTDIADERLKNVSYQYHCQQSCLRILTVEQMQMKRPGANQEAILNSQVTSFHHREGLHKSAQAYRYQLHRPHLSLLPRTSLVLPTSSLKFLYVPSWSRLPYLPICSLQCYP